jgi:hypothetical protein
MAKLLKPCPFCEVDGLSAKAHINPKALFLDIGHPGEDLKLREPSQFAKRTPQGVWDDEVWCRDCEDTYGRVDSYAIDVLRTPIEELQKAVNPLTGEIAAHTLKIGKPGELKLFFITLLWRASQSKESFYKNVSLGPRADAARQLIRSRSPGSVEDFSVVLTTTGSDEMLMAGPVKVRHSGALFYRFYMGRYRADIKANKGPAPPAMRSALLGLSDTLVVLRLPRDRQLVAAAQHAAKDMNEQRIRKLKPNR